MICTLQDTERVTFQFEQWVLTPAQNKLRSIRDGVSRWPSSIRKSRREEVIVTRLRVGHTSLTHGFLLRGDPPPVCEFCDAPLSVYHILVECRKLAPIRLALDFNGDLRFLLRDSADGRIRECELALRDSVASVRSKRFPPLRRGALVDVYLTTAVRPSLWEEGVGGEMGQFAPDPCSAGGPNHPNNFSVEHILL
uniref:Uncharacterized protein n=1 Tax=Timema poppense TaxID=170557 RepID=A0A7R9GYP4_TIMPO|nr:unnamed protein product [Timema poppensis]